MSDDVRVDWPSDEVARIRLDSPPRNAGTWVLLEHLHAALLEIRDGGARIVVLGSDVPGYFLAHGALDDIAATFHGGDPSGDGMAWYRVLRELDTGPLISIAAVEGQAWGGGATLAFASNLRVVGDAASFAQPEVAIGLVPGAGGVVRLTRLAGEAACMRLVLDPRPVDAEEARRLGLVHRVVEHGRALAAAEGWARYLASLPARTLAECKQAIVGCRDLSFADALRHEGSLYQASASRRESLTLLRAALERYASGADSSEALLSPYAGEASGDERAAPSSRGR